MPFARGVASRRSHTQSASCTLPSSRNTSTPLSLLAPRARQRLPRLEPCLLPQNHDLEALKVVELPSAHKLRARLGRLAVGPLLLDLLVVPQLLQSGVTDASPILPVLYGPKVVS